VLSLWGRGGQRFPVLGGVQRVAGDGTDRGEVEDKTTRHRVRL